MKDLRGGGRKIFRVDEITVRASKKLLRIVIDNRRHLIDEWERTCGSELVKQLVVTWSDLGALCFLKFQPKVPPQLKRSLRQAGFDDTVDKLIVAIALHTTDRAIVSEDSDFWDPEHVKKKGAVDATLRSILEREGSISVYTLKMLVDAVTLS